MKHLLLLLALLLGARPAGAQASRPAARLDSLTAPLTITSAAPDTVAALHRLFAAKRRVFRYIVGGTAAGVSVAAAILLLHPPDNDPGGNPGGSGYGSLATPYGGGNKYTTAGFAVGITSIPVLLVEVVSCMGWGRKREQKALADFGQHQLSFHIRRRLKAKYFH